MALKLLPLPSVTGTDAQSIFLNQRATELNFKRLQATATGALTGTITSGYIPVADSASDLINSIISQSGTTITVTGNETLTGTLKLSALTASTALALDASKNVVSVTNTGSGNNVLSASPTLTGTITAVGINFSGDVGVLGISASLPVFTDAGKKLTTNPMTGSGSVVMSVSPTGTGTWTLPIVNMAGDLTITGASKNISFSDASAHIISTTDGNLTLRSNKSSGASTITIDTVPAETGNSSIVFSGNGTQRGAFASGGFIVNGIGNTKVVGTDGSGYMTSLSTTGSFGSVVLSNSPTITTPTFSGAIASGLTASRTVITDGSGNFAVNTETGTGSHMRAVSPTTTGTLTGAASNWSSDVRVSGNLNVGSTVFSVTSAGFVSIGGINSSVAVVLDLNPWASGLIGSTQVGVRSSPTFASDATTAGNAIQAQVVLAASSFTQATSRGILIKDASLGGLIPSITTLIGLDIETQTKGGTNLAIRTGASGAVQIGNLTASQAAFTDASKNIVSNAITGSGNVVMSASPTLTGTITAAIANFSGAVTCSSTIDMTSNTAAIFTAETAVASAASSIISIRKARGSIGSEGDVVSGDTIADFRGQSYSGGTWFTNALVRFAVDGTYTSGQRPPGRVEVYTNAANTSQTLALQIDKNQNTIVAAAVAATAGGNTTGGLLFGSSPSLGVYFGSGAPTISAGKGSLYLRTDGTTTNNRHYVNTDGSTTWTAVTTVA